MANTYLQRTPTTRTNNQKFTYSCWFKRSEIGTGQYFVINLESGNDRGYISFDTADKIFIYDKAGGTERFVATSNFVLRDTSAWYHLVYSVDSTAGSNRVKIYINGVDKYSDFTVATAMSQNSTVGFQQGTVSNSFKVGSQELGSTTFNGLMSHINFVDGLQLDASTFGETDANGVWTINTSPTVSEYGNNGFFILKDGNSVTDQSGEGNNLTVGGGTLTNTEDNPSNVFACLNGLHRQDDFSLANGNNTFTNISTGHRMINTTLAASAGKYYAEVKATTLGGNYPQIGIIDIDKYTFNTYLGASDKGYGYLSNGNKQYNNSATSFGNTYTTGDIIGIAMDLDNNKLYFSKNGTWQNSGDPTSGSTGTGSAFDIVSGVSYSFGQSSSDGGTDPVYSWNFGNGYFGTTAVSSAGTNASGIGIFEYDVPTGYTALSTKGLNL